MSFKSYLQRKTLCAISTKQYCTWNQCILLYPEKPLIQLQTKRKGKETNVSGPHHFWGLRIATFKKFSDTTCEPKDVYTSCPAQDKEKVSKYRTIPESHKLLIHHWCEKKLANKTELACVKQRFFQTPNTIHKRNQKQPEFNGIR